MQKLLLIGLVALAVASGAQTASAHEFKIGDLEIIHPVARPTMGSALNSAVYLTIRNDGSEPDTLVVAYGPKADKIELHESVMEDDVMKMQHFEEGIEIPANGEVHLSPGGEHIMLMGLAEPLNVYDTFAMTLVFENAGSIDIEVYVVDPSDLEGDMDHGMDENTDMGGD